jgi:hypothetical protein
MLWTASSSGATHVRPRPTAYHLIGSNPEQLLDTTAASVSHLPSNIAHQMLGQKYTFGVDEAE